MSAEYERKYFFLSEVDLFSLEQSFPPMCYGDAQYQAKAHAEKHGCKTHILTIVKEFKPSPNEPFCPVRLESNGKYTTEGADGRSLEITKDIAKSISFAHAIKHYMGVAGFTNNHKIVYHKVEAYGQYTMCSSIDELLEKIWPKTFGS